ncbi:heterokaryon incompatibility protein-domain-containing protein [Cladorrhinum sp. PSN259]|nr:heterokaryon incompatibility protein-domain-containing protein [Cladorrhinum sp. PSN259]
MASLYHPLDSSLKEIRLVQLLPLTSPSNNTGIVCKLQTVSLLSKPQYIALSYVWGNPAATSRITVNGLPFQATINLVAALRQMRSKEPILLWIDAICINQKDNSEKSTQIQLMRDIYEGARIVTVWLGESDFHTDRAIKFLSFNAHLRRRRVENEAILAFLNATMQIETLDALESFFKRDWWGRIWIVQEVALARRALFLCGSQTMLFDDFKDAYVSWSGVFKSHRGPLNSRLRRLDALINKTSARVILWQHFLQNRKGVESALERQYSLEYMLEECWNFDSTDPRDKVYAWLGIAPDCIGIVPDYNGEVSQVYVGLVRVIMEHSGSLSLVSFTGSTWRSRKLKPIENLPSWAPDLRKDKEPIRTLWLRPKSFRASSTARANATISTDGKILVSDGFIVGRLAEVDGNENAQQENDTLTSKLGRWLQIAIENKNNVRNASDAFLRTLIAFHYDDHISFDSGHFELLLRKAESFRVGYIAYLGYLDRVQDCLRWGLAHPGNNIPYQFDIVSFKASSVAQHPSQVICQHFPQLKLLPPQNQEDATPPPRPTWTDFENVVRFLQLWGIDINSDDLDRSTNICASDTEGLEAFVKAFDPEFQGSLRGMKDWSKSKAVCERIHKALKEIIVPFAETVSMNNGRKSFFVTDSGHFGVGTNQASLRDRVAIVRGCSLPLLVREHELGDAYEVLGQCYVWGCMSGEYVDDMEAKGQQWERLVFR